MGREILFRGKRKDIRKWVEGYYVHNFWGDNEDTIHLNDGTSCVVKPETVCQYAGFSDCNKTKVFEGDILKGKGKLYIVEFDSSCGAFTIRSNAKGSLRCFFGKTESQYMEVVGNIYDNPELLNQ